MSKFSVGQPVWAISVNSKQWRPGVVTTSEFESFAVGHTSGVRSGPYRGHMVRTDQHTGSPEWGYDWFAQTVNLRPRNPDQFTAADDFDVQALGRPRETA